MPRRPLCLEPMASNKPSKDVIEVEGTRIEKLQVEFLPEEEPSPEAA